MVAAAGAFIFTVALDGLDENVPWGLGKFLVHYFVFFFVTIGAFLLAGTMVILIRDDFWGFLKSLFMIDW